MQVRLLRTLELVMLCTRGRKLTSKLAECKGNSCPHAKYCTIPQKGYCEFKVRKFVCSCMYEWYGYTLERLIEKFGMHLPFQEK